MVRTFFGIVGLDVPDVMSGEFVDGLLYLGQASLLPHLQRREVRVGSGSVPITLKFLDKCRLNRLGETKLS